MGREELKKMIEKKINSHAVMIFSKQFCPYCKTAKQVFDSLGVSYEVMDISQHADGSEIQDILREMTGARTVPRVFVGGKCIGGGSETKELHKSGKLKQMIEEVTA